MYYVIFEDRKSTTYTYLKSAIKRAWRDRFKYNNIVVCSLAHINDPGADDDIIYYKVWQDHRDRNFYMSIKFFMHDLVRKKYS